MELHAAEGNGPVAETIEPHFSIGWSARTGFKPVGGSARTQ
jgi:hypothetical protein